MTVPVFVDANVLVCRHIDSDHAKQVCAEEWIRLLVRHRCGRLSIQVLTELYSVLTRELRPTFPEHRTRGIVRDLLSWQPPAVDSGILERGWNLQAHYSISWWDALVVAVAQASACSILLTENLQHDQVLGGVSVIDPFASPEIESARIKGSQVQ